jgi:hypothetical protein
VKKIILLAASILVLTACKKDDNNATGDPTFTLKSPNAYIDQELEIAITQQDDVSYNINYGDGSSEVSSGNFKHRYAKTGIYTITITTGAKTFSKKIRIFPGTASYQLSNDQLRRLENISVVPMLSTTLAIGSPANLSVLNTKQISDTIFITKPASFTTDLHLRGRFSFTNFYGKLINFELANDFFITPSTHNIFTFKNSTIGTYYYSSGSSLYFGITGTIETADNAR